MRFLTAGESHGPALTVIVEGFPAGVPIDKSRIDAELVRRQKVAGRGERSRQIETDEVEILSGVRSGFTLGSPIALMIQNRDWPNWEPYMRPVGPKENGREVICPRPGHADLAGGQKYGFSDLRSVLERASARETAARTAAGTLARLLLEQLDVSIFGYVDSIGDICLPANYRLEIGLDALKTQTLSSPVLTPDPATEKSMRHTLAEAQRIGETLGGTFVVEAHGLPPGLGSYVHWDRRLDGRLGQSLLSIPAVKGVTIGPAFGVATRPGSLAHDPIHYTSSQGYHRPSNLAGGLEGGMTTSEPLILRSAVKPIPTLIQHPLASVDILSRRSSLAAVERSDICAVPAACIVGIAAVAWELAQAVQEKFGGDTLDELKAAWKRYQKRLEAWPPPVEGAK